MGQTVWCVTRHTLRVTRHITCHTLRVTRHTSHVTRHMSHVTLWTDAIQEKEAKRRAAGLGSRVWSLGFGVYGFTRLFVAADANDFSFAPVVNENSMILASAIDRWGLCAFCHSEQRSTSHVARRTLHVTRHTSHVTRHTSLQGE